MTAPEREKNATMARAGEQARVTGRFACERCNEKVSVEKENEIPECPTCGNGVYVEPSGPSPT